MLVRGFMVVIVFLSMAGRVDGKCIVYRYG